MKKLLFFCAVLCYALTFAQNSNPKIGSVTGQVKDTTTQEPIPYATITIENSNKEVVTGGITDDNGNFSVKNIPTGTHNLKIQFIGYTEITKNIVINSDNKSINLGTVLIEESAEQLDEVEVVAERSTIEQKIDRKVINVGKDLVSAGATAGEIMNNIPSVSVDQQTNDISLRGNANVRILVDGKPTNIDPSQLLQQIPSASIKQVELITNPSAKYNPEGMSGIINIVLHKNSKMGFNGSLNQGITFGITPKYNGSLDLNYRVGKVNVYGNYGFNTGRNANEGYINSFESGFENRQDFDFNNDNTSHLVKAGIDYYLNEKNTLSFYTTQNIFRGLGSGSTNVNFEDDVNNEDLRQIFSNENDSHSQTYNLDYRLDFAKEGHNIELEVNYNTIDAPEDARFDFVFDSSPPSNRIDDVSNERYNLLINLDYVNPLSETAKLEFGLESRTQNTDNALITTLTNGNSSFSYDRQITSFYGTYSKQWGKWSAQLGARLENYDVAAEFYGFDAVAGDFTTETFTDKIFTVYPSTFITYTPNEKNSLNLSYSRRVDRPGIGQVNPIREWSTPQIDSRGNPELNPQFTNSLELNYTRNIKIGSITTGVFYRRINDEITRTVSEHPVDDDRLILSYGNFDDNNAYGFELSGNLRFTPWWSANVSTDLYAKTVKGTIGLEYVEVDVTTFNARMSNNFKASKNLRFQLFGFYRGRDLGLQFEREPMWKMDVGASYNILQGQGTISTRFSDIFNSMNFGFDGSRPYPQTGQFNWESQTLYIGFNYRFGGGKYRALQRKRRDANEKQGSGGII